PPRVLGRPPGATGLRWVRGCPVAGLGPRRPGLRPSFLRAIGAILPTGRGGAPGPAAGPRSVPRRPDLAGLSLLRRPDGPRRSEGAPIGHVLSFRGTDVSFTINYLISYMS